MKAKTIGIVGGIGPESTIDYYRLILTAFKDRGVDDYKSILINSVDLARLLALAGADDREGLVDMMLKAMRALAGGGAELAILASNTPHLVFDEIQNRSPIPLVSIVASTCEAVEQMGLAQVGLIGTKYTMEGGFYQKYFARRGIAVLTPDEGEREYIHEKYLSEIVPGIAGEGTRAGIIAVLDGLRQRHDVDGVILGGTELPLLLRGAEYQIPLLDTARIHAQAVVQQAIQ